MPFGQEVRIGYHQRKEHHGKPENSFSLFEQGVNEKIAEEVFCGYLAEVPDFAHPAEIQRFLRTYRDAMAYAYAPAVRLANAFVGGIAQHAGFSPEMVWRAVVRGQYEGENFDDPDLRSAIEACFPPAFLERLAGAFSLAAADHVAKGGMASPAVQRLVADWTGRRRLSIL